MNVYTLVNAGQFSRRPIAYFKSSFSQLLRGKWNSIVLNAKSNVRVKHFNIKDDVCCKKKNRSSFILYYLVKQRISRFLNVKINLKTSVKTSGIGSLVSWCGICFMALPSLEYSLEDWPDFSQILCQKLWYISHSCEMKIWVTDSHYWFHLYCVPNSSRLFTLINVLFYS